MKSRELRELVAGWVRAACTWLDERGWLPLQPSGGDLAGKVLTRLRFSPAVARVRQFAWGLAAVIVLVDLFLGRYVVVGPAIFAATSFIAGTLLGRWMVKSSARRRESPESASEVSPGTESEPASLQSQYLSTLVIGGVFTLAGVFFLATSLKQDMPGSAAVGYHFTSGGKPLSYEARNWFRARMLLCIQVPLMLFFGGTALGAGSATRSRATAAPVNEGEPAEAVGGEPPGPSIGTIVFVHWVLIIIIGVRLALA